MNDRNVGRNAVLLQVRPTPDTAECELLNSLRKIVWMPFLFGDMVTVPGEG